MALLLETQHFKDCGKNWIDLFESYLDSNWVGLGKILLFLNFLFFPSILPSSSTIFSWPVDADILISAVNRSIGSTTGCTITEKAPTRAFSWLKAPTSAFTFKTLLRHYATALTPRSLNVKLGPRRNYHKGRAVIRHYANLRELSNNLRFKLYKRIRFIFQYFEFWCRI